MVGIGGFTTRCAGGVAERGRGGGWRNPNNQQPSTNNRKPSQLQRLSPKQSFFCCLKSRKLIAYLAPEWVEVGAEE